MRKLFFSLSLSLLFLTSLGLLKPPGVQAVDIGLASPSSLLSTASQGGPASPSLGGPAGKMMLRAVLGPKAGEVTLRWGNVDSADNYHLVYGTDPKNMKYGALNIGKSNVYTVGKLNPGTKYYFALVPVMNNVALYTSEWVSAWTNGGQVTSVTPVKSVTPVTSIKPVTSVTPVVKFTASAADKHWLVINSGPKVGEVTMNWRHTDVANNYHLVYGTQPGKYEYGALNIGWVNRFTVRNLTPGKAYYFALVPVKNDVALYTSGAVKVLAKTNAVQVVQTTKEAVMQPKTISPKTGTSGASGSATTEPTTVSSQ